VTRWTEVSEGLAAIDAISRPRKKRRRLRLTAAENNAIEQRAVEVTRAYFDGLEYETKDVGSTESYDIKASWLLTVRVEDDAPDYRECIVGVLSFVEPHLVGRQDYI
jgi:hypothetical protein